MNSKNDVFAILERHLPDYLLTNYTNGRLNPEKNKLYGFALTEIDPARYHQYSYLNEFDGYVARDADQEKQKTYSDGGNCYQLKDKELCMQEGVYTFFAIIFFGCLYEGQWYILKELRFYGTLISKPAVLDELTADITSDTIFNSTIYRPVAEYYSFGKSAEKRSIEFLEFLRLPELVAYNKKEEKQALLAAHKAYLELSVFKPFMDRLRADNFETFNKFNILHGWNLLLIFSSSRNYVLMPVVVVNGKKERRLYYFFWHENEKKMYRWNYFGLKNLSEKYHYANEIIEDLSKICYWNSEDYLGSTCTLDDENFWNGYVLTRDNGHYRYLEPMKFDRL
ncbi:MAG: hypothetical protein J7539_06320 [Niabella sp.]|nr:hypothetical protein [Niabella sp.]